MQWWVRISGECLENNDREECIQELCQMCYEVFSHSYLEQVLLRCISSLAGMTVWLWQSFQRGVTWYWFEHAVYSTEHMGLSLSRDLDQIIHTQFCSMPSIHDFHSAVALIKWVQKILIIYDFLLFLNLLTDFLGPSLNIWLILVHHQLVPCTQDTGTIEVADL